MEERCRVSHAITMDFCRMHHDNILSVTECSRVFGITDSAAAFHLKDFTDRGLLNEHKQNAKGTITLSESSHIPTLNALLSMSTTAVLYNRL